MKPTVIDPKTTTRAAAFDLWMSAPNPMVTFFKTLDVTPLVRFSRKRGLKFNMLLCWCIGKAASGIKEFYTLPVGCELLQYDSIAVNTIVKNKTGEIGSCDVPFSTDLAQFSADYLRLTHEVAESCENHDLTDSMVIGTSAIVDTEIDGAVGMNSGIFNNPFIIWGKYHIAIEKAYWGHGVGRALTLACIECAKQAGYLQIELEVVAENASAVRLYESVGFQEYGRNPRGFRARSGWQTLVLMRLELDS